LAKVILRCTVSETSIYLPAEVIYMKYVDYISKRSSNLPPSLQTLGFTVSKKKILFQKRDASFVKLKDGGVLLVYVRRKSLF